MPNSNTLTITGLQAQAIRLPLRKPFRNSSGALTTIPLILTEMKSARGIVGRSIVFAYNDLALKPLAELINNMAPNSPVSAATLEKQLEQRCRLLGLQGLVGMALAAIDIALWDALAKRHECNLIELLGGEPERIPAYAAIGFEGARGSALAAKELPSQGFHGIKVSVGYATVQEDLNVIQAVRQMVGDEVDIMVDYNQCLSVKEAIERIRVLNDAGLSWVEEPIHSQNFKGLCQVRQTADVAIQCGENWWNTEEVEQAIQNNATDYIMLGVMKCGGVSGWLRAAELTRNHHIPLSSHFWPELSTQLLSLTPTAHWLQYSDWWQILMKEPLKLHEGCGVVNEVPGAGMDWDESIANYYRV